MVEASSAGSSPLMGSECMSTRAVSASGLGLFPGRQSLYWKTICRQIGPQYYQQVVSDHYRTYFDCSQVSIGALSREYRLPYHKLLVEVRS